MLARINQCTTVARAGLPGASAMARLSHRNELYLSRPWFHVSNPVGTSFAGTLAGIPNVLLVNWVRVPRQAVQGVLNTVTAWPCGPSPRPRGSASLL